MNVGKEKREGPEFLSPIYELALNQFLAAAKKLDLDDNLIERMRSPDRTMLVTLPVEMDDGKVKNFYGYRVQHNTSMGPGKGGIRYHPDVNLGEISALAMWMTWKGGLMNLPLGGAKGGVTCNPKEMSMGELERLTRRYTYAIFPLIGPDVDVPAPDVGTNAQTMAWIMDSYSVHTGFHTTGVVTGKPPITGGSKGRDEATGQGVFFNVMDAAKKIGLNVENATVAVQGFGNVGHHAAKFLHKIGAKVIAISNSHEGAYNSNGIPVEDLFQHSKQTRDLASFQEAVAEVLVNKTVTACKREKIQNVVMTGGVAANSYLRERMKDVGQKEGFLTHFPKPVFCTDNGAMIACAAYYRYKTKPLPKDYMSLDAHANLAL